MYHRAEDMQREQELRLEINQLKADNARLREIIDDITEVVEASDPALVQFIAKRMERVGIEVGKWAITSNVL